MHRKFLSSLVLLLAITLTLPLGGILAQDATESSSLPQPTEISWNSDGTLIAVGTKRDGIFIYDTAGWEQPPTQIFVGAQVYSLAFVPQNPPQLAVSIRSPNSDGCGAGENLPKSGVFVYDLATHEIAIMIRDFTGACVFDHVHQLQFSDDGSILATNTSGGMVSYTLPAGDFRMHLAPYYFDEYPLFDQIAISGDGSQLALAQTIYTGADEVGYLFRADYSIDELVGFEDGRITKIVTALALSYDGMRIVIGDEIGSLRTYFRPQDASNYSEYQEVIRSERSSTSNRINAIALDPDGAIVTAESDPQAVVRVFDPETLTEMMSFSGGESTTAALDLAFNPDGSLLAVLVDDTVRILDTSDYTQVAELVLPQD